MIFRGICPGSWKCCVVMRGQLPSSGVSVADAEYFEGDSVLPSDQTGIVDGEAPSAEFKNPELAEFSIDG